MGTPRILSERDLENTYAALNPGHFIDHVWSQISHAPLPVIGLILLANATLLTFMASRLPKLMHWQLPEAEKQYPVSPLLIAAITLAGGFVFCMRITHVLPIALLLAMGVQALFYAAVTDFRDRWIPDHITTPMILIGLAWHPLCTMPSAIEGAISCMIAAILWFSSFHAWKTKTFEFSMFSGGDILLGAAIGTWLGPAYGLAALVASAVLLVIFRPAFIFAKRRGGQTLLRFIGYDRETETIPVAPILAFVFFIAASVIPDPLPDLTPVIDNLREQRTALQAELQYEKDHPEENKAAIQKRFDDFQAYIATHPLPPMQTDKASSPNPGARPRN